ncbi:MAG: 50S ribosomal protein L18 [Planctomycetota bacterium]
MRRDKRLRLRRFRRSMRVRNKARGTSEQPRLHVFRSNKHIYAQLIDDESGKTLCASSTRVLCGKYGGTVEHATQVGADLATKATGLDIKKVKFDRGPYRFHGRVRALAEAAREKGLQF